ncbi:hypothetical protein SDC9_177275 [bioreactor metagenome]|uniref:Uncharacterized protein n=1 Tax=bioreactor metagenome TaxID=1076179 RepID=A0A645GUZ9_9ZZZZ
MQVGEIGVLQENMDLVPLELIGRQDRDDIFNIRLAGNVAGQGLFAVIITAAAAGTGGDLMPAFNICIPVAGKDRGTLTQDDGFHIQNTIWQA